MDELNAFRETLMVYDKTVFGIASMVCTTNSENKLLKRIGNPVLYVICKNTCLPKSDEIITDFLMPEGNFFLIQQDLLEQSTLEMKRKYPRYTSERFLYEIAINRLLSKHIEIQTVCWGGRKAYLDSGGLFSPHQIEVLEDLTGCTKDDLLEDLNDKLGKWIESYSKFDHFLTREDLGHRAEIDAMLSIVFGLIGGLRIHNDTATSIRGLREYIRAAPNTESVPKYILTAAE